MNLQELLTARGIDLKRTKLVRHNLSSDEISKNYEYNRLEDYQKIQRLSRFQDCDTVISFLGEKGTNGVFLGCYSVNGYTPFKESDISGKVFLSDLDSAEDCVVFDLRKMGVLSELENRLVIDWGKGTINWCQNGTTEKEILEIRPYQSKIPFPGYEDVILSYEELREIVCNSSAYKEWENKLSAVAGVYLITDLKTGQHYVGSASGVDGGIWARWSGYARTKHGGNKKLVELIVCDPDYCRNFQFSILEVLPLRWDRHEVLHREKQVKRKLDSMNHGLNEN